MQRLRHATRLPERRALHGASFERLGMHERFSSHPEPSLLPFEFSTQVSLGMLSKCDCYFHLDLAFLPNKLLRITGSKSDLLIVLPRHHNL
jgi:hypothetical protein